MVLECCLKGLMKEQEVSNNISHTLMFNCTDSLYVGQVYKASHISARQLKGAQERRVIYDSLSFSSHSTDFLEAPETPHEQNEVAVTQRSVTGHSKAKAYGKV